MHLLSENQYIYLQKQISKKHWRKHEPDDNKLPQEHPSIFKTALDMLLDANLVTKQDLISISGLPIEELEAIFRTSFIEDNINMSTKPYLRLVK
ncbi:hypothetical protein SDC49_21915 [Lactobacillus sp. R2/2]|nr:hypothetical protein [Lactobacillus sp. R2/2]